MPRFHASDDLLLEYAAGSLSEPAALLVATHLALCPECRRKVWEYEAVGGALLQELPPAALQPDALERALSAIDLAGPDTIDVRETSVDPRLPQPLRDYVGRDVEAVAWRSRGRGIHEHELSVPGEGFTTKLIRIAAGETVPRHTHEGNEITLVLSGGFTDEAGHYERGDIAFATADVDHSPQADPDEDCLCLAVTDGALRLTGPIGRFLNLFVRV